MTIDRRGIWLRLAAGLAGAIAAPVPQHEFSHSGATAAWVSVYLRLSIAMWKPPWSLLLLIAIFVVLYRSRFDWRGVGVAFCFGAAIVMAIQNL